MNVPRAIFTERDYFWSLKAKWRIAREILNLLRARWDTESGKLELKHWVAELEIPEKLFATTPTLDSTSVSPTSPLPRILELMRRRWLRQRHKKLKPLDLPTPISIVMDMDDVGKAPAYKAIPISPKELLQWEQSSEANPFVLLSLPSRVFEVVPQKNHSSSTPFATSLSFVVEDHHHFDR